MFLVDRNVFMRGLLPGRVGNHAERKGTATKILRMERGGEHSGQIECGKTLAGSKEEEHERNGESAASTIHTR